VARRFRGYVQLYKMEFSVDSREELTLPAAPSPELRHARRPGDPAPSPSASPTPSEADDQPGHGRPPGPTDKPSDKPGGADTPGTAEPTSGATREGGGVR
jgi:hypothetical protein